MSTNIYFKKGRLIWEEFLEEGLSPLSVEPKISFDSGISWMSLGAQAVNLRNGNPVKGGSIKPIAYESYNQLDIEFSFTPYAIPSIITHEVIPDETNGDAIGTYYFILKCVNFSSPGLVESDSLNYDSANILNNHSKVYKVNLETKGRINLFVNFPYYASGLCLYKGYAANDSTFPVTLKLAYISNITNALLESINEADNIIWLKNKFPLPKVGRILIDSEYIEYSNCEWDEKTLGDTTGDFWKLTVSDRGVNGSTAVSHTATTDPTADDTPVFLANYSAGYYGELPPKVYNRKPIIDDSLIQFITYDPGIAIKDITFNTSPTSSGSVNYEESSMNIRGTAIKFNGLGVIDSNQILPKTGSAQCFLNLIDIINSVEDPVIFGNSEGFWIKISKFNLKPYFGYQNLSISSYENSYIPSLGINIYHNLGFSWRKDPNSDYLQIYMFIGDDIVLNEITTILYEDFDPLTYTIGGFKVTSSSFTNTLIGNVIDWRLYNKFLVKADYENIIAEKFSKENIWCAKIETDKNSLDYSVVDSTTALNTYDPLHTLSFTFATNELLETSGREFSIIYDPTILESYLTDATLPSSETFTYPVDPDLIQVRFDMQGEGAGFQTPIIKNIALIISEGSLS